MSETFAVKRVAVLGAGVMGAQIAAHCVNAGIETFLFDLAAKNGKPNSIVDNALNHLKKIKPTPLAEHKTISLLKARNYEQNLPDLLHCDLVIEAIAERMDWKKGLYQRISPFLKKNAVLMSNTSGLSINSLAEALVEEQRTRFCGIHFFNPPRYMHLVELIAAKTTDKGLLDFIETWFTRFLGKGIVRARDTPNFIANRIGVFSLLSTMHHAEKMGLGLDEVDALTGTLLGRPKSATYRTMDIVGLDTMAHVVDTMKEKLKNDPWHRIFELPQWLKALIKDGHLGQKTGQGIYRKAGRVIEAYDVSEKKYRPADAKVSEELITLFRATPKDGWLQRLFSSNNKQARFLKACFCDLFQYSVFHLEEIASSVRDVDLAMRWGFGWHSGPFELWQESSFEVIKHALHAEIKKNVTLSDAKLPKWIDSLTCFYEEKGAFSPQKENYVPKSKLPVYQRQIISERILKAPRFTGDTLFENDGIRLWNLRDDVAVVSFKSKANTLGRAVVDGLKHVVDKMEQEFQGLIIYQEDESNFSSGANLHEVATLIQKKQFNQLSEMISDFQTLAMKIKYSTKPVVAALRGRALGGGCELMMHCDRVIADFESYPGLVEVGVGLIPAGGGCKEMAMRAAHQANDLDIMMFIQPVFEQIAMGYVASSAPDAQLRDYLKMTDSWVMHRNEVLYVAKACIKSMQALNYTPPIPCQFKVAGIEGQAKLQAGLLNWREGGFISPYDYFLATRLAHVLCGGEVYQNSLVDEAWLLKLEKEAFITLAATEKTQERIHHLLTTGKPLRN